MIDRYTRPEMGALFTAQRKFETWLRVEIAILEALADRGEVPAEDVAAVKRDSYTATILRGFLAARRGPADRRRA